MGAVYTDQIPESVRVGGQLNNAVVVGLLLAADPNTDATVTALKARVNTRLATLDASLGSEAARTIKALDRGVQNGLFPETHAVTTMAALVALTDASPTTNQGFLQ